MAAWLAAEELRKEKGWEVPIHVDAASGGFVAPFVTPDLLWDFRLPNVRSINVSGHKSAPLPVTIVTVHPTDSATGHKSAPLQVTIVTLHPTDSATKHGSSCRR